MPIAEDERPDAAVERSRHRANRLNNDADIRKLSRTGIGTRKAGTSYVTSHDPASVGR